MPDFQSAKTRADAVKLAKEYLKNNPTLKNGNLYQLPDGTKLRVRKKEGGRLSAENYDTKTNADIKRGKGERQFTHDEAKKNAANVKKLARQQSQSTLHRHVHGSNPSAAEHSQNIASGGIGDDQDSVSDPFFVKFKNRVEQKVANQHGDKYIVDINEVTGYLRVIPRSSYNKEQNRSQQPGFDLEPDMDVDLVISSLPFTVKEDLSVNNTSFPGLPALPKELFRTPPTSYMQPTALGGFDMSRLPKPSNTAHGIPAFKPPSVYDYKNGNGNGNGNGDGNGNGSPPPNGNGGNGGNGFVDGLTSTASVAASTAIAVGSGLLSLTQDLMPLSGP